MTNVYVRIAAEEPLSDRLLNHQPRVAGGLNSRAADSRRESSLYEAPLGDVAGSPVLALEIPNHRDIRARVGLFDTQCDPDNSRVRTPHYRILVFLRSIGRRPLLRPSKDEEASPPKDASQALPTFSFSKQLLVFLTWRGQRQHFPLALLQRRRAILRTTFSAV